MLVIDELASKINDAIAAKDKDGNPIAVTPAMKTYANAIITTLKAGIVNNVPGTVTSTGAPGAPIPDGAASGGLVSALIPATWVGVMVSGNPTSNPATLLNEATISTGYLMSSSLIAFQVGGITGTCTATPVAPGILAAGAGTGGKLSGIDGSAWDAALAAVTQGGPLGKPIYTAIADYVKDKIEATYLTGTVVGAFAIGGGPLIAGAGIGGTLA